MRSSYMKSMRYAEHSAIDVHIDLILTMRKTYCRGPPSDCRGPVVRMIHILVVNLWID
jgi:hypothetical protein